MRRTPRTKRKEMRYDSSMDICRFRYWLSRAVSGKKNTILNKEILIIGY